MKFIPSEYPLTVLLDEVSAAGTINCSCIYCISAIHGGHAAEKPPWMRSLLRERRLQQGVRSMDTDLRLNKNYS